MGISLGRSGVTGHCFGTPRGHGETCARVEEEFSDCGGQCFFPVELTEPSDATEFLDDFGEILHGWSHDDRTSRKDGLDGILPSEAVKTLPDHDDLGEEKPRSELSGGVRDPDALRCSLMSRRPNPVCSHTEDRIEAGVAEMGGDFISPFGVPGDEDEPEVWEFDLQRSRGRR